MEVVEHSGEKQLVLMQLTRQARSALVKQRLRGASQLARQRQRVTEAGFELQPAWAGGAWVLEPLDERGRQIVDAFGNPNIFIVTDRDQNGVIESKEFESLPARLRPESHYRGGVVVYAGRADDASDWEWITGWD